MSELQKIGLIAARYDISSRTLRYYEEVGILKSTRREDSSYRYYDSEAINRLEQILLLRKMQLPIKDICDIFSSTDMQIAIDAFMRKLRSLEREIEELEGLKEIIDSFLGLLREKGYNRADGFRLLQEQSETNSLKVESKKEKKPLNKEAFMMENITGKLTEQEVRIIELKPMKVAYYCALSASPEKDAWDVMLKWAEEKGLRDLSTTRYFGFNNPCPTPDNPVYGYEVWITVSDNELESDDIKIKEFSGGLYAVTNTFLYNIGERWMGLAKWVEEGNFDFGKHQGLEESIAPSRMWHNENTQLDLYCPINEK